MNENTYNGWTNYETWNVALWLDNEQGSQEDMIDLAREYRHEEPYELGKAIKDYVEEQNPLASDASMWSDLLNAALSEVDWTDIAEHYLSDLEPEESEDDTEYWFYDRTTERVFTNTFLYEPEYDEFGPYDSEEEAREAMVSGKDDTDQDTDYVFVAGAYPRRVIVLDIADFDTTHIDPFDHSTAYDTNRYAA